jgi:hypothetical protein
MYLNFKADSLVQVVANSVTLKMAAAVYSEILEQNMTLRCVKKLEGHRLCNAIRDRTKYPYFLA